MTPYLARIPLGAVDRRPGIQIIRFSNIDIAIFEKSILILLGQYIAANIFILILQLDENQY